MSNIQAETWDNLDGGVDGEVFAIAQMGVYMYVGGDITAAGGNPVNNIARYDLVGSGGWEPLGQGVNNSVNSLVVNNGVLYVGGAFTEVDGVASTYFAMYDGSTWSKPTAQPVLTGLSGMVTSMVVMDGYIYVGGDFDAIGELSTKTIARYSISGGTWEAVTPSASFFTGFGCTVPAMATDGTSIYVSIPCSASIGGTKSGLFTYTPGTGTWAAVGDGLDELSAPFSLLVNDGFLYAAGPGMYIGDYNLGTSGAPDVEFFGRYDLSTPSSGWASLGNPLDDVATDFVIADGSAYVIGQFTSIDALSSQGMAVLDLETLIWSSIGAVNFSSSGGGAINNVIELIGNKLVVGGVIENAGGTEVSNIARYSKTFTGGGGDLPNITLSAPGNTLTNISIDPFFDWVAPDGVTVTSYSLFIDDTDPIDDSAPFVQKDEITATEYQYGFGDLPLLGGTTYHWIIKAYNGTDLVAQTVTPFSFTTEVINTVTPTLVAPVDAQDVSLTPTFTWSKDPLAESYVLEYSTGATLSGTPTQVNLTLAQLTDADQKYSYALPEGSALEANTQYSWRVTAKKTGEADKPSAAASFKTIDLKPGAFAFTAPTDDSFSSFPLELAWTESERATSYQISIKIGDQYITSQQSPLTTSELTYSLDATYFVDGFTYTLELNAVNEDGKTAAQPYVISNQWL